MGSMASRVSTTREGQTPPPLAPEGRRALGLVTLWDGSATHECAIPLWCQSAQRLASMIPPPWQTQLVVIAPRASDDVPPPTPAPAVGEDALGVLASFAAGENFGSTEQQCARLYVLINTHMYMYMYMLVYIHVHACIYR